METAAQAQSMSIPRWGNRRSSPGIVGQVTTLFIHPKAFFQSMPRTGHWLFVAVLVLCIAGFAASNQVNQGQSSAATSNTQASGFNVGMLQGGSSASSATSASSAQPGGNASNANMQTTPAAGNSTGTSAATASTTPQASSVDANATLMAALLTACGVLVMWAGQAMLLCWVTMLNGYSPNIGRSLQISVWASLPLALMLVLRQVSFAMGGTGGSVGLSVLLTQWNGYARLPELAQRVLAVFTSNMTLFWLWNLALLYLGARYALGGNRLSVVLVIMVWIITASVVPALVGNPVTTVAPRTTASVSTQQKTSSTSSSSTANQQSGLGVGSPGGGAFPGGPGNGGGAPPSGPGGS
jgi:hypothetical protein